MNKTFEELGYNVGDTVRCVAQRIVAPLYTTGNEYLLVKGLAGEEPATSDTNRNGCFGTWELVSRKEPEYPTWGEMTPEEQGALLLAHHNGSTIQMLWWSGIWFTRDEPNWSPNVSYRQCMPIEPVVVTHEFYGAADTSFLGDFTAGCDTHKITFNTSDGEPDCESVLMTKL